MVSEELIGWPDTSYGVKQISGLTIEFDSSQQNAASLKN